MPRAYGDQALAVRSDHSHTKDPRFCVFLLELGGGNAIGTDIGGYGTIQGDTIDLEWAERNLGSVRQSLQSVGPFS